MLRLSIDWLENFASGIPSESFLQWLDDTRNGDGVGEWSGEWYRVERVRNPWLARLVHVASGVECVVNRQGAFVTLRGGVCTRYGAAAAYDMARLLLSSFGTFAFHTCATRIDVACDVTGWEPRYPMHFSTVGATGGRPVRPTFHGVDMVAQTFETVEIGVRGAKSSAGCMVVVYDKSRQLEAVRHDADYSTMLTGDWSANGWAGEQVWRVESRVWRARIDAAGLTTADILNSPGLGLRLGLDWAGLFDENGAVDSTWLYLREYAGRPVEVQRSVRLRRIPSEESLVQQCMRLVARYHAAHDCESMEAALIRLAYGCEVVGRDGVYERKVSAYRLEYGRVSSVLMDFDGGAL